MTSMRCGMLGDSNGRSCVHHPRIGYHLTWQKGMRLFGAEAGRGCDAVFRDRVSF